MTKSLSQFSFLLFAIISIPVMAQQEFATTSASTIGYLQYLPESYKKDNRDYPVLIFLHGIGERGPNTNDPRKLAQASKKLLKHGPPKHISRGTKFPFIVISPQLKSGFKTWPVWYVMEVINHVKNTLRIDEDRIYLSGLSLGGGGAWTVAQEYPKLFAALAPVCGGYNQTAKARGIAAANLPVWAFHGDRDPIVPLSRSQRMVDAINSYNPGPKAKLSVYRGVKHDAWENAYNPGHSVHAPNLYDWLMTHSRKGAPTRQPNVLPVVQAGKDFTLDVSTRRHIIKGGATDKDGKIVKYQWTKTSGGQVTLQNAASPNLTIAGFKTGKYTFRLNATDDQGGEAWDEVNVTITETSRPAPALFVSAGPDKKTAANSITITGIARIENGKIKSYSWKQMSGAKTRLQGANSLQLKVSGLKKGNYSFRLSVWDDQGNEKTDNVTVAVSAQKKSRQPRANAGRDIVVSYPVKSVQLHGSAVSPNGRIVSTEWLQVAGRKVRIANARTLKPVLTDFRGPGGYAFKLVVRDEAGMVRVDHVRVRVNEARVKTRSIETSDSVQVVDDPAIAAVENDEFQLGLDAWDPRYTVIIFNDRGQKLQAGPWTDESYRTIFVHAGFYIYQVWEGSRRVHTGKVIVQ